MVVIIDGKEIARRRREEVKVEVEALVRRGKEAPKLAVVLVGDNEASQIYVRNKEKACEEVGIISETRRIPLNIKTKELIDIINELNKNETVDGILVQLPLPKEINEKEAINAIQCSKDVDGIHPFNMGKLLKGDRPSFIPCTPQGIMEMILSTRVEIKGKRAVVVGRSNIVGKPMALLLLQEHATVTICHSRTKDLGEEVKRGDIVIAAVGSPEIIRGEMIKEGAVVIDVGMNRLPGKLVGDVEFEGASKRAGYISPVPGGVGPMTIAMLLKNTLKAAKLRAGEQP
jgi:methylenetetrahydrofolate dehydrogenase (NADP+)/methenyltetrahydrofolate cyclohydrolase